MRAVVLTKSFTKYDFVNYAIEEAIELKVWICSLFYFFLRLTPFAPLSVLFFFALIINSFFCVIQINASRCGRTCHMHPQIE